MRAQGFTLVEALVALAIVLVMAATAFPVFRAMFADAHVLGAGRQFKSQFRLACSTAVRSGVYTAIRFERRDDGTVWYAVYQDGDRDGVRSADIAGGRDTLLSGPFPLTGGAPGVSVAINPGIPALPPETGLLSGDPVRFGSSDILSFSPFGTATPGTFYLAGDASQAAVRVTGGSARVRLMVWRGGRWRERS
jgi:prepilin-type N-terminal cleavage/methylation domain-containing protein